VNELERKLAAQLLLARRAEDDSLVLSDAVLMAALDGSRKLSGAERAALEQSPLMARRLRHLSLARRHAASRDAWSGSHGMLRAAASGDLAELATDDGFWQLHFVAQEGRWQVILKVAPAAPFAARLVCEQGLLRVSDGAGATVLQGHLDADGEYEAAWPFSLAPGPHFQQCGAVFAVTPAQT
jgi:hypothetical protein